MRKENPISIPKKSTPYSYAFYETGTTGKS